MKLRIKYLQIFKMVFLLSYFMLIVFFTDI